MIMQFFEKYLEIISNYIVIILIQSLCPSTEFFIVTANPQNYTSDLLRVAKALQMKAYMNEKYAPCENFYKFACGNWNNINPAPMKGKTSYLDQLQNLYWRLSVNVLETPERSDTTSDIQLKNFYESCRSSNQLNKNGLEAIFRVADFKGGWPKITNHKWYESDYDWLKTIANLRGKIGVNVIIGLKIVPDFQDNDMNRIMIGAPEFDYSRDVYIEADEEKENIRQAYTNSIQIHLQRYFPEMSEQWAFEVAKQILYVEKNLAVGLPLNKPHNIQQTTRLRYPTELKAAYGNYVDLNRYLNLIFNQTIYTQVYETPEDYVTNLVEVIKLTPKLTIANYTMWKVLQYFDLNNAALNKSKKWCAEKVIEYFSESLESIHVRNYPTIQMINQIQSVWSDIEEVFRNMLLNSNRLNWLSVETRQRAIEKLDSIELKFPITSSGYLPELMKLRLNRHNFYENLINILHKQTIDNLRTLFEPASSSTSSSSSSSSPSDLSDKILLPQYNYESNKIHIPLTFLQYRFLWDITYPKALLYSTLGYSLAQQMLKGFDSQGRKYDKHGYQRVWWDHSSVNNFDERSQCFVKQYSKYDYPGWIGAKNETPIKDAYIRDNGALFIAYQAYKNWWMNMANTELAINEKLPGLDNYSQNRLFFLGFAQLWCADYDENVLHFEELPEYWLVIGTLANFNEFSYEYHCDIDTDMNPTLKCELY